MQLTKIVNKLDENFEIKKIKEDWKFMINDDIKRYATKKFIEKHRGLMFKNSEEVEKIYTSCFPSHYVIQEIIKRNEKNTLLVVHHPFDWDGKTPFTLYLKEDLEEMKKRGISVYAAHLAWDKNRDDKDGLISTGIAFAKTIGLKVEGEFCEDLPGVMIGVYGSHEIKSFNEFADHISNKIGKGVRIYKNHSDPIERIGIVTGGASEKEFIEAAHAAGADTYITGVTQPTNWPPSVEKVKEFFEAGKRLEVDIIGAGHYLTEKFAPQMSISYFKSLGADEGVDAEFIEDKDKFLVMD